MKLAGVLTPIPTPFDERDVVDLRRLRAALAHWMATSLDGIVVLGSNGEAPLLDEAESDRMVAAAREGVPANRTFIVGTGRESTRATIDASIRAARLGADAVLVRTPAFFKPQMTPDAFVRHYMSVADASRVPVLLYNYTALTGVTLPVEAVKSLSRHQNIIGMKESNGDVQRAGDLVAVVPEDFTILAGSASTFFETLRAGARGGILAAASVVPDACGRILELTRSGRLEEARAWQERLLPLARLLGNTYGVPALKAALKLVGCDVGWPRPPLAALGESEMGELTRALSLFEEVHGRADRQALAAQGRGALSRS